jgi:hypothetical protein
MLRRMIEDFMSFIALILILLVGFGAAYQGVSQPAQSFDARSIMNILYRYAKLLFAGSMLLSHDDTLFARRFSNLMNHR